LLKALPASVANSFFKKCSTYIIHVAPLHIDKDSSQMSGWGRKGYLTQRARILNALVLDLTFP